MNVNSARINAVFMVGERDVMSVIARLLPDNPVLTKEMRVRMRGARAYWILFGYLGFLCFVLLTNYGAWQRAVSNSGAGSSEASRLGGDIFNWIIVTQMFLVLFIAPAITSGSITIEHEQRTMDMLTLTRMRRRDIIAGKLLSAVLFTGLLLVSSLPVLSICFMLGGVDPAMVFSTYLMLLSGSFFIGSLGLMWSSIARTTTSAVMYTYASLFVLFLGATGAYGVNLSPFSTGYLWENVFRAIGAPWFGNQLFGLTLVGGAGFALVCLLGGWLLGAVSMSRLEILPERKAGLLRGLTLFLVGVQLLSVYLWWLNAWYHRVTQSIQISVQPPVASLILVGALLMLAIPTFATGELRAYEARRFPAYLLAGWTPKGLRRGKMASGIPFLLIMCALSLLLYCAAFVLVGKGREAFHSAPANFSATTGVFGNPVGIATTQSVPNVTITPPGQSGLARVGRGGPATKTPTANVPIWGDFPQAALVLLAFTLGFSLLCMALSLLFRNRWVAWLLANVLLLLIWVLPQRLHPATDDTDTPTFLINLYILNPLQALWQLADPVSFAGHMRPLAFGEIAMWRVTSLTWLAIGGISLVLSLILARREGRYSGEIPYEDMVAEA